MRQARSNMKPPAGVRGRVSPLARPSAIYVQDTRVLTPLFILLGVYGMCVAGCSQPKIETAYGQRRSSTGDQSVAGTAVLAQMFEAAGHSVTTQTKLTPRMERYDTIVWFPDSYDNPHRQAQQFLEEWLRNGVDRTLIYVGRDYDAASVYWKYAAEHAPPAQAAATWEKAARLRAEYHRERLKWETARKCRWFSFEMVDTATRPRSLTGPLADGVDAKQTDIFLWSRLRPSTRDADADDCTCDEEEAEAAAKAEDAAEEEESFAEEEYTDEKHYGDEDERPFWDDYYYGFDVDEPPDEHEPLLATGEGDPLVMEVSDAWWSRGRVIVVANGSFLLNLPLANAANRRLAANLIEWLPPEQEVVFLETGGWVAVYDEDTYEGMPTGLEVLSSYPAGPILMHFAVLGILYLLARAPIFGRPRSLAKDAISDFGKHVAALARLFRRGKDYGFMDKRITEYHTRVRGDADFQLIARREEPDV